MDVYFGPAGGGGVCCCTGEAGAAAGGGGATPGGAGAAAAAVPPALVRQLKPGGRLVIPVGEQHRSQDLRVLHKNEQGVLETRSVLPVVFVPLVRDRE